MNNLARHLTSLVAPIVMCFLLPYLILLLEHALYAHSVVSPSVFLPAVGALICVLGFVLLAGTIRMFILIGNGTIMPWDPTRHLITSSLYAYLRNPMILSLVMVQIGEALLFASIGIAILAVVNIVVNTVYFIRSEEPGLEKRFGEEYVEYKKNVPRWLPRLKPWKPGN